MYNKERETLELSIKKRRVKEKNGGWYEGNWWMVNNLLRESHINIIRIFYKLNSSRKILQQCHPSMQWLPLLIH